MTGNVKNKVQRLKLENFTCFSKAKLEFSNGINVFIGENGTGKTQILKVLYSMVLVRKYNAMHGLPDEEKILYSTIKSDRNNHGLDRVVNKKEIKPFNIFFVMDDYSNSLSSSRDVLGNDLDKWQKNIGAREHNNEKEAHWSKLKPLFIPTQEMLTLYPGFISYYENTKNPYDSTYRDLAVALNGSELQGKALETAQPLFESIEDKVGIKIELKNDHFYLKFNSNGHEIEAPLAAEGLKKLAQLIYLIRNGSLTQHTTLFWDEPEVNLNPKYITVIADFLQTLARQGVQIFVATHDYLLAHLLSTSAEYENQTDAPSMRFFSFYKGVDGTEVETGETLAEIQNNSILDEYSAYFDLEQRLYDQKRLQSV